MIQRSPTYIAALPNADGLARLLARILPARAAYGLTRWRKHSARHVFLSDGAAKAGVDESAAARRRAQAARAR